MTVSEELIAAVPEERRKEAELAFKVIRLRQALGYFLADVRFTVTVGGNPHAVDAMVARAKKAYEETAL